MVIGLSTTAFVIFLTTKDLEQIDNLRPWAQPTVLWPQILTLVVACISWIASAIIIISYLRVGHRGAERNSYLGTVAMLFGMATWLALWIASGASLRHVKVTANRGDLWGWACARNNKRYYVYRDRIDYDLMCKIQAWNFICSMINIGAWVMSATVIAFSAYRLGVLRRQLGRKVPETQQLGVEQVPKTFRSSGSRV